MRVCREVAGGVAERMDWFAWGMVLLVVAWGVGAAWRVIVGGGN